MKRKIFCLFMVCSLIAPHGTGLVHAFNEHEENSCQAKNDSHFHSDRSDCKNLHYFSQAISNFTLNYDSWTLIQYSDLMILMEEFLSIKTMLEVISDRGPPVINAFKA